MTPLNHLKASSVVHIDEVLSFSLIGIHSIHFSFEHLDIVNF